MSAANIKQSALAHFAKNGYEGASLKHIADDCGIKTVDLRPFFEQEGFVSASASGRIPSSGGNDGSLFP